FDRPAAVRVGGLAAGQEVVLRARLHRDDGRWWSASAAFVADAGGRVDLPRDAPTAGSYTGVDAMGLFWAMQPDGEVSEPPPVDPVSVHVGAEVDGRVAAEATAERRWLADGATVRPVEERGLVGHLAEPPGPGPHPAVMVVHGSAPWPEMEIAT